ncbi:MAG TPA: hypothetical protein VMP01_08935 [Pirellulaceae bacterium]|nr:hypothetical protein [Pirellulaceae bacterium]
MENQLTTDEAASVFIASENGTGIGRAPAPPLPAASTNGSHRLKGKRPGGNATLARFGLSLGRTGKGHGGLDNAAWKFLSAMLRELEASGRLTFATASAAVTAARLERCALAAQRFCRNEPPQNVESRSNALERVARFSRQRDEVLERAGLLAPSAAGQADPFAALATGWPTAPPAQPEKPGRFSNAPAAPWTPQTEIVDPGGTEKLTSDIAQTTNEGGHR